MSSEVVPAGATACDYLHLIDKIPIRTKSEVPVLLAPGYSETSSLLAGSIDALLARQRRVITLDQPRRGRLADVPLDFILGGPKRPYTRAAYQRSLHLLDALTAYNLSKVDVIAHSQGCIDVVAAASMQPESFRNLVLVNPAGMVGEDTFVKLLGRFAKEAIHAKQYQVRAMGAYVAHNPLRAMSEGKGIAASQINPLLSELHAHGIGVVMIGSVDDAVFPMQRLQSTISAVNAESPLDGFLSLNGRHSDFHMEPERYTAAAEMMLSAMEAQQASLGV